MIGEYIETTKPQIKSAFFCFLCVVFDSKSMKIKSGCKFPMACVLSIHTENTKYVILKDTFFVARNALPHERTVPSQESDVPINLLRL